MTSGGGKLNYPGDARSTAVSILGSKIYINSTISDSHRVACYLSLEIFFNLGIPMTCYQCLCVHRYVIPDEFMGEYNLHIEPKVHV